MKRSFLILLAGVIGIVAILYFRPKPSVANGSIPIVQPTATNIAPAAAIKNVPAEVLTQTSQAIITPAEPQKPLDVAKAKNLADWTNAIPNIKQWSHFRTRSSWVADQRDTNNYPIMLLTGVNGNTIQYKTKLTSVDAMGNHVREIELQTPYMNIDETRTLGIQLCNLLGIDSNDFLKWCDKVGNNWVDVPLYATGKGAYGFQTLQTFNTEKPWFINFIIQNP